MTKFQIILLSVFGVFIVGAVMVFALYQGGGAGAAPATVTIWGDISGEEFNLLLNTTASLRDPGLTIRYVQKPEASIDQEFTEALARGEGPDLIILPQDKLWKNRSKLMPMPYSSISERDFQRAFVEEGELLLDEAGIYGLPISIDPMVLYFNRDLLSAAGYARPIEYWDEIYTVTTKLTRRDAAGNLIESTVALGETRNIPNAKEILTLLFLQAGTPITGITQGELRSELAQNLGRTVLPAESALDFYTQFSNPAKSFYSWNRALPDAQTRFTSGDLAYYLGFASELRTIRNKNPNLNFAVATVPQSRASGQKITFGRLRSISISRATPNSEAALRALLSLVSKELAKPLSEILSLPPARRDLLSETPNDAVMPVFYEAALQSRGFLDPNERATRTLFNSMIDSVTSGRSRTLEAINTASRELETLIQ